MDNQISETDIFLILDADGGVLFEGNFGHFRDVFFDNVSHDNIVHFVKDLNYSLFKQIET